MFSLNKLKYKLLVSGLCIFSLFMIGCDRAKVWKEDNGKWYCYDSDQKVMTGWFKDKNDWFYADNDGVMQTGWLYDKGNWYYLYSTGQMAHDTTISGYYLNSSGAWTTTMPPVNQTAAQEVRYYKRIPVVVTNTTKDSYYTNSHSYSVSVTVRTDEYNLEKTFYLRGSNMGGDPYAGEVLNDTIKKGDTIYAEMFSWKIGDTVTRRELNCLER